MHKKIVSLILLSLFVISPLQSSEVLKRYYQLEDLPELFTLPLDVQRKIVSMLPNPFRPLKSFPERLFWIHEDPKYDYIRMNYVFSNDESHVAISYRDTDNGNGTPVALVSIDGKHINTLRWDSATCTEDIIFSPDDTEFFCLRRDNLEHSTLAGFKEIVRKQIARPPALLVGTTRLSYTPDNKVLAINRDKAIYLADPCSWTFEELNPEEQSGGTFSVSPDCSKIYFLVEEPPYIKVFDVGTRSWFYVTIEVGNSIGPYTSLRLTPDGQKLLIRPKGEYYIYVWDLKKQQQIQKIESRTNFTITPDSKFMVASSAFSGYMRNGQCFYSIETGAFVGICAFEDPVFSPTGKYFIVKNSPRNGAPGVYLYKTNPLWYELARDFAKPLSFKQYFFMRFLHALNANGVTLTNDGLAPLPRYTTRITVRKNDTSPITEEHILQFKETFSSFSPTVQKYLRMKYSLRNLLDN